jgi:hypothetical protein
MLPRLIARVAAALALAAAAGAGAAPMADPPIAPARDGDIAIRQELDAARRAGTVEAYDLFIARHPGHPLVEIARRERALLARPPRR